MILQLNPPLPREIVSGPAWGGPVGKGICNFLIDEGPDSDLIWVIELDSNGEIWAVRNRYVRAVKNITAGRRVSVV